jgi:hypothetical protein
VKDGYPLHPDHVRRSDRLRTHAAPPTPRPMSHPPNANDWPSWVSPMTASLDHGLTGTNRMWPGLTKRSRRSGPTTRSGCRSSIGSPVPCPMPDRRRAGCPRHQAVSRRRQPLVSCTDDHAHQCRLMLWIEDTLLGMCGRRPLMRRRSCGASRMRIATLSVAAGEGTRTPQKRECPGHRPGHSPVEVLTAYSHSTQALTCGFATPRRSPALCAPRDRA